MGRLRAGALCALLAAGFLASPPAAAQDGTGVPEAIPAVELETAPVAGGGAAADELWEPQALTPPGGFASAIEEAWLAPADSLEHRVWRTRRSALERGVWSLDAAARALLSGGNVSLARAEAAVELAPDLPAAKMALARALWLQGESTLGALRTAAAALFEFTRHPEAGLWLAGTLLLVLAVGLAGGGLLTITVLGVFAAPHAAHDLGDLLSRRLPGFARAGLLAALLLLLPALGEGLLGLGLVLLVLAAAYARQRLALALAAAAVWLGAFPLLQLSGAALEALPSDPVAEAALATSRGVVLPADVARLRAAPADDLLAQEALARVARREGSFGTAYALYKRLLAVAPDDLVVVNNAANVHLHLGHMEEALELYRKAFGIQESPLVLYNLAQAYGRAFQVDDLTETLELAQSLDGELVADLTRLQGTQPEGFVLDLPISSPLLWRRVLTPDRGRRFAAEWLQPIAPGRLGGSPLHLASGLGAALLLGWGVGLRLRASRWCARCGRRVCPRCHPDASRATVCGSCNQLFYQPENTDRDLRTARIEALRQRERRLDKLAWVVSVVLPGAAGPLSQRPLAGLLGAVFFSSAAAALVWRAGVVPDPLVAGAAGPLAFLGLAVAMGAAYAVVVGASLAARRNL